MATPKAPTLLVSDLLAELGIRHPDEIDIGRIAAHLGIDIRFEDLDGCAAHIVGFGEKAIVTIDRKSSPGRQRFSAGHEMGHWIYDRGKGLALCNASDMNVPWNARSSASSFENRANKFSAELLMPASMFRAAAKNRSLSFEMIEELSQEFRTSRTATAIRLIDHGAYLAMLMLYDPEGRRLWFCASKDVPSGMFPTRLIPRSSRVWDDVTRVGMVRSTLEEASGESWIDHYRASEFTLMEQSLRVGRNILVLVWWPEDGVLSEFEDDEQSNS